MGCFSSHPENKSAIDQDIYDIPLLNKSRTETPEDFASASYFTIDSYTSNNNKINLINNTNKKKLIYEGDIIEHSTFSLVVESNNELLKKQKFNEIFSHIEVSTFTNIPIMSVQSHIMVPSVELQNPNIHDIEDYFIFMDRVLNTIITPLTNLKILDERNLII